MDSARATATEGTLADERMTALCQAHSPSLYRFLLRLTLGQRQAAEDLLQETLLRAWRHLDGLPSDVDSIRPWLFTVARRIAIDAARTRQVRPKEVGVIDLTTLADEDDPIDRLITVNTIRSALTRLTPNHRRVLQEIYVRRRSTAQTATILNIPEGTVKSRTHHALRALRVAVGE